MKKIIAVYKNGFSYKQLPEMAKVNVYDDIREFIARENLKRFRAGKGTFLNSKLELK